VKQKEFIERIKNKFEDLCEHAMIPYYTCISFLDDSYATCRETLYGTSFRGACFI